MTRGRTASGASMWKKTRGSCLTSKCKRGRSGLNLKITWGGGERWGQIDLEMLNTESPGRNTHTHTVSVSSFLPLVHIDTVGHAHGKVFLRLKSLIRFFFVCYIKNSVLLPARSLTRLASKPPCSHFPSVCLRVGFEMNMLWQWTTLSHLSSFSNCNSTHTQHTCTQVSE